MTDAPTPPYVGPAAHTSVGDNKPIKRIVIHATVSPCQAGGARDTARYFRSEKATGSAHYVADPVESVQVVFDSIIAWHAPPNPNSIGYELCDPMKGPGERWHDAAHNAMLRIAARDVAALCKAYNVPIKKRGPLALRLGRKGICGHVDVSKAFHQSTHWDPGPDFPWKHFLRLVQDAADGREYVTVKAGETLTDIATRGGVSVARLWRLNRTLPSAGDEMRVR